MCAVKFAVVGTTFRELHEFDVEEKSYSPEASIKYLTAENYQNNLNYKHVAAVCALNNRSRIIYENGQFKI